MLGDCLKAVRDEAPRIHCITNYVTMNDCANVLLACGASPIMANAQAEAAEITALCDGLTINIGTLSEQVIPAMLTAGKQANELGYPMVLDPVGAGASAFRTRTALLLLEQIHFSAIRGNASEIRTLAGAHEEASYTSASAKIWKTYRGDSDHFEQEPERVDANSTHCGTEGVDANALDRVTEDNVQQWAVLAGGFARKTGAVIAMTGVIDLVTDGKVAYVIRNGHPMMSRVTGTGCQLSVLTAAFLAARAKQEHSDENHHQADLTENYSQIVSTGNHGQVYLAENRVQTDPEAWAPAQADREAWNPAQMNLSESCCGTDVEAVAAAVCAMGLSGEKAVARMSELDGNATYRNYLIDAIFRLTPDMLENGAKYEIRHLMTGSGE